MYICIYIYISIQCVRAMLRVEARSRWPPMPTLGAKLSSQGALGRHIGLPRRTWAPSWTAKVHLDAILTSNWASKCPPRAPPTPQNHAPVQTRTQIPHIACCALEVLLTCFLAALGAFLSACWAQLEASWAPLRLNLEPLGRLWGSSSGLLAASRAALKASWAPPRPS